MSDNLNDDAVEAFLSGQAGDEPLGALLASIADRYRAIEPSDPRPELAAFISTGGADAAVVVDLIGQRRSRKTAIIAVLTGTLAGKVLIGVSVAAASVAGMQARGTIDVPMLPDTHHRTVVERPEPAATTQPTTTTTPAAAPAPAPTPAPTPAVVTPIAVDTGDDASAGSGASTEPIVSNSPQPIADDEHHDQRNQPDTLVSSTDDDSHDDDHDDGDGDDDGHDDDHDDGDGDDGNESADDRDD